MARRTRRAASASASASAAVLDNQDVRHYKEASILKPVSPSTHTDNWPCFLLSNATVHRHDGSLANQLEVDLEGPFIIRGRLELEKDNERYLVNRQMKTEALWIQIESSHAFSVGAKDDGLSAPVVWASGGAGWFEIVPAERYQPICDIMFQGVCLHYSFLDQYEAALEKLQKSRKKKKATLADVSLGLDEILFQYALRAGDGLTLPEAYQRLDQQCVFLLSHFPRDTGVFHYLSRKFPNPAQQLAANKNTKDIRARMGAHTGSSPLRAYDYDSSHREKSSSLEMTDGGKMRKKGKESTNISAPRTTRTSEASDVELGVLPNKSQDRQSYRSARMKRRSPAEVPREEDVVMVDSASDDPTPPRTPHDQQGKIPSNKSSVNSDVTVGAKSSAHILVDALEDTRREMLRLISEGRHKKQLDQVTAKSWQTKVYMECNIKHYKSTAEIFHYHARELVRYLGPEWHETQIYQWIKDNASTPPTLTLISEAEVTQIVRRVKKAGRGARAGPATVSERPQTEVREEYAGKQTPTPGSRPSGKAAGLRPSTGSKKRLRYDIDLEDKMDLDEGGIPKEKKKSKRSHSFTEEDDDDDDHDENSLNGSQLHRGNDDDDDDDDDDDHIPMTQFVIRAETLPSTNPQGPNKTWICEEPDCGFIVRAAHEEKGRKLISAHYEQHEKEAQDAAQEAALDRENLAVQEATRGHMPIKYAYFPPFLILIAYDEVVVHVHAQSRAAPGT
ncbi:hypothetical protein EV127DRAFT_476678 [Xylaria flabelliformis]|nr:hypothetical protein EV127DRAFT_476678 [Xylaria flabelliformis]